MYIRMYLYRNDVSLSLLNSLRADRLLTASSLPPSKNTTSTSGTTSSSTNQHSVTSSIIPFSDTTSHTTSPGIEEELATLNYYPLNRAEAIQVCIIERYIVVYMVVQIHKFSKMLTVFLCLFY